MNRLGARVAMAGALTVVVIASAGAERGGAGAAASCYDGPFLPPALPISIELPLEFATVLPTPFSEGGGSQRTVAVTGTATADRAPDTALVVVHVRTAGADARTARCANDRAFRTLRTRLAGRFNLESRGWPEASTYFSRRPTPPPGGGTPWPVLYPWQKPPYGWVAVREYRITATPGKQVRDAVDAARAVHADGTEVRVALTNRTTAYGEALAGATRAAVAQARAVAAAQRLRPRLVRAEVAALNVYTIRESAHFAPVVAPLQPNPQIEVRASLNATFGLEPAAAAGNGAAPVLLVHAFGRVSRPPDIASVTTAFSAAGNDRTALLHHAETTYDALLRRLRALRIEPKQIPHTAARIAPRPVPAPRPSGLPEGLPVPAATPERYAGFMVARDVVVNGVPLAKVARVMAAFEAAGAKNAEVTYVVKNQREAGVAALADARHNADAQATAIATAAGLRRAGPPHGGASGPAPFLGTNAFSIVLAGAKTRMIIPPAHLDGRIRADFTYELTR